jgi:O-succinylbenzoate synthase
VKFRGVLEREIMLFEGPNGWCEWSPFVEYPDDEAVVWLRAAIEFGWGDVPEPRVTRVPVNATVPAVTPERALETLARFGEFSTVKIKVAEAGQTRADDIARVVAVQQAHRDVAIRLDANGALTVDAAVELAAELTERGVRIDYFEQPVASVAELAEAKVLLNAIGVRVAADESVRKASDPMAVVQAKAADVLVLKAAPLGGVAAASELASAAGLPWVVSSALESSIGISMGAHLAAQSAQPLAAGLATLNLFAGDVCDQPLAPKGGWLEVKRVTPSAAKLDIFAAEDHRQDWWFERLERCYALL